MKAITKFFLAVMLCVFSIQSANAQEEHFDVEFGYEGGMIEFESSGLGIDAAGIFEAEFEVFNMDGTQVAEDPGFASNFMEGDETFMTTSGDSIFLNANQSSTLGTYLTYFNPTSNQFESTDATLTVEDNSPGATSDLIVTGTGLSGDLSQYIVTSDGFEIDTHVDYILSSGAQDGLYGILLNLESDNLSGDLMDATSEQFWVVFNNGLSEKQFEGAIGNFSAVPEPSSFVVMATVAMGMFRRRRI